MRIKPLQQKTAWPRLRRTTAMLALALALPRAGHANDIQVTNIDLTGQNTADGYTLVRFDLNWENSWRTSSIPNNWDAAWVFVKYRVDGTSEWKHAHLNPTGHSPGSGTGAEIKAGLVNEGIAHHATTNPAVGAFIYRDADGTGTFSITGAQLRWNYAADGVTDTDMVDIWVFAIEMVYAPEGAFYLGSGGTEVCSFTDGSWTGGAQTPTIPFLVTSENALTIGSNAGELSAICGIGNGGTLPTAYPKGFGGFYSMKYEISQGQYRDFLNTLSRTQQAQRFESTTVGNYMHGTATQTTPADRNGVRLMSDPGGSAPRTYGCDLNENNTPNEANDGEWIACNYISWMDGAAYLDWAGLRPMTELEFEKACRGVASPVPGEYAWGSTNITQATSISNGGMTSEGAGNSTANAVYGNHTNVKAPLRVGAFAKGSTTREEAGTSYYGIMELSGNLWERHVTVVTTTGRNYTGLHGNGRLSTGGHADVANWPGLDGSNEVTGAGGSGLRGGDWATAPTALRASDRNSAGGINAFRDRFYGFRGVLTVPSL